MSWSFTDCYRRRIVDGAIEPDAAQEAVLPAFDRLSQALAAPPARRRWFSRPRSEPVKGLYLWGGVGRGKSMLMDLFFATARVDGKRRVHFHTFMQEVHAGIGRARKGGADDAVAPVVAEMTDGLRLLCLDEMQIGDITDAMIVGRLFEGMLEAGIAIVTTSNRPPRDLYKNGLNRNLFLPFIALIENRLEVVELASPKDWRQDRIAGSDRYFAPADGKTRTTIDAIWQRLSGDESSALRLRVTGRDVVIPSFSAGVARASFQDLCGRPLGAADYLAIADAVRVLILEDVPKLTSERYNEARRFVTLIDALYEARVRTIISAAEVPERLYPEGEGAFEFARTASRLREMMSADWGADEAA